jgi:fumarylacetoacetase
VSLDETHDPSIESWVESANSPSNDFPIQNLPLCRFRLDGGHARGGTRIGDSIFEVDPIESRLDLSRALRSQNPNPARDRLHPLSQCELLLPVEIRNYTDFYASIFHAANIGRMFRPDSPLLPNYKYVPIGYHGRASSIVLSGTDVVRPAGQLKSELRQAAPPVFLPSRQMDYECELGCIVSRENTLGEPVPIEQAEDHMLGVCLVNDWSARDIQRWEYQPLGPFLSKSFATSISPWIVTREALEPFRVPRYQRPSGDPAPLPYLECDSDRERGGIAITLEVWLLTEAMRTANADPVRLSRAKFEQMYWTFAQMLTHHASNGCKLLPGDLLASGTVSGPGDDERGCLLELTSRGTDPVVLPGGETRAFLQDGDEVILRGYAERDGFRRIGLGECRGKLVGCQGDL